jgi:hypothetical protein
MRLSNLSLLSGLFLVFVASQAFCQQAQSWLPGQPFDTGEHSTVAVLNSNLVVEFHQSENNDRGWYHIGQISDSNDLTHVNWGPAVSLGYEMHYPSAAVTQDGYVVVTYTTDNMSGRGPLYYRVGRIDPYGYTSQKISWQGTIHHYSYGVHSSLSINENDVVAEVHNVVNEYVNDLDYRMGHLERSVGGDLTIAWDSPETKYDTGINPSVTINNQNEVIEEHQRENKAHLFYRRGVYYPTPIGRVPYVAFEPAVEYTDNGYHPSVVFMDENELVDAFARDGRIFTRTGVLSSSDPARLLWTEPEKLPSDYKGKYPSLASNGRYNVAVWDEGGVVYYSVSPTAIRSGTQ